MPSIESTMKLVDYASVQNDRWLMLAMLVILLVVMWLVARYFVRQHETLIADHKTQREEYTTTLRELVAKQAATAATLQVCIDRNSKALEEHTEVVRECKKQHTSQY
jgi:hypothetical protein